MLSLSSAIQSPVSLSPAIILSTSPAFSGATILRLISSASSYPLNLSSMSASFILSSVKILSFFCSSLHRFSYFFWAVSYFSTDKTTSSALKSFKFSGTSSPAFLTMRSRSFSITRISLLSSSSAFTSLTISSILAVISESVCLPARIYPVGLVISSLTYSPYFSSYNFLACHILPSMRFFCACSAFAVSSTLAISASSSSILRLTESLSSTPASLKSPLSLASAASSKVIPWKRRLSRLFFILSS